MASPLPFKRSLPGLLITISGAVCALLGLLSIFGWHARLAWLTQIRAGLHSAAVQREPRFFSERNGVTGGGRGTEERERLAGALTLALGVTTVLESLGHLHIGLDPLFTDRDLAQPGLKGGQMSISTAICLLLASFALLKGPPTRKPYRVFFSAVGALLCALGAIAFFGYIIDLTPAHTWGADLPMPVQAAIAAVFLGAGFLVVAGLEPSAIEGRSVWRKQLPLQVGAGLLASTCLLWQALLVQDHLRVEHLLQEQSRVIRHELVSRVEVHVQPLLRIARAWGRGNSSATSGIWKRPDCCSIFLRAKRWNG